MRYVFFFICFFITNLVVAQKVDLDPKTFNYSHYQLPEIAVEQALRNYSVSIPIVGDAIKPYVVTADLKQSIKIDGLGRVSKNAGISIEIRLLDYKEVVKNISEKTKTVMVNNINQNVKYYQSRTEYLFTAVVRAIKTDNKQVLLEEYSDKLTHFYFTPEVLDSKIAQQDGNTVLQKIITVEIEDFLKPFVKKLDTKFGYVQKNQEAVFYYLDSKKHPEFTAFNAEFGKLESIMKQINISNPDISTAKIEATSILKYFETLPAKYAKDEKGDKKLRYAGYYNASLLHYCLDNLSDSEKMAQKVVENQYDEKDGKGILAMILPEKKRMETNNASSRHLSLTWNIIQEAQEEAAEQVTNTKKIEEYQTNTPKLDFTLIPITFIAMPNDQKDYDVGAFKLTVMSNPALFACLKSVVKGKDKNYPFDIRPEKYQWITFEDNSVPFFGGKKFQSVEFVRHKKTGYAFKLLIRKWS